MFSGDLPGLPDAMALTHAEQRTHLLLAKREWIEAQGASFACEREFVDAKRRADRFKWLTLALASLTTVVSAVENSGVEALRWLTTAAAVLTAIAALYEKQFVQKDAAKTFWERSTQFQRVMRDVRTLAVKIQDGRDPLTPAALATEFAKIGARIEELVTSPPVRRTPPDRDQAEAAFERSVLANVLAALGEHPRPAPLGPESDAAPTESLPDDAPGVVSAYRRPAVAG